MRGGHQTTSNNQLWRSHRINWSASTADKATSDNTNQRHWIRGNLMSTKNRTRRTTTRNIRFLTKWLNKLTSLLSKRDWISQPGSFEACRRRLTSERRHTSIKSDEEWTSRVLPSEQDDIVNSLNYEGIAVNWVAVLPLSWQWQTACWLCHRLNSLND